MRTKEEIEKDMLDFKNKMKKDVKWSSKKPESTGGQSCGMPNYPVTLTCDELDIEITIGYHKSNYKNKALAACLFDLALDDIIY